MKKFLSAILAILLVVPVVFSVNTASLEGFTGKTTDKPNVAFRTKYDIANYLKNNNVVISNETKYDVNPSVKQPYSTGKLSSDTIESSLSMINAVRYISGLSNVITADPELNEIAQTAALINAANEELSHTPEKPVGMDEAMYQLGYKGCSESNIGMGYQSYNQAIIVGWLGDSTGLGNQQTVGHRRWILNPAFSKTGIGLVKGEYSCQAMHVFDESNVTAKENGVCWPAQNTPEGYFEKDFPWSISLGYEVTNPADIKVTLTRKSDNKVWSFSQGNTTDGYFYVNNQYFGLLGCIIFCPKGVKDYVDGDSYSVSITGLEKTVNYDVDFFDTKNYLQPPTEPVTQTKLGDTDKDGEITILDATLIQRWLAKLVTDSNEIDFIAANVDKDEGITVMDATMIQKHLAKMLTIE